VRDAAVPSPERSALMRSVRTTGTSPELMVRRALSALGVRYRINVANLPGKPDIANKRHQFAVLVHGCFWHRHPNCPRASIPKTNTHFWLRKFRDNCERDRRTLHKLNARGIQVLVVWECQTRSIDELQKQLVRFFGKQYGRRSHPSAFSISQS